jgi:hypothetical protein
MPITAKLSRQFYDKLGDDVADELVDWFNAVDLSYRQEFRELFEANFGRLEARLGQQMAEMRTEMGHLETRLIRWMFGFWVGAWVAVAGTIVVLERLR